MDFALSTDQEALRDGVRSFCEGRIGLDVLRRLEGHGFDRALWRELAELGVFGLRANAREHDGTGTDGGLAEAALVFEALGRAVAPGPILWTHIAADLVAGAASGDTIVTGLDLTARRRSLHEGPAILVEHLACADVLLVLREDGLERHDAGALLAWSQSRGEAHAVAKPLDPLTPLHRLESLPAGERIADAATADRLRLDGTTLASALLLGIAEEAVALATRHANERQQFDRPIGSFQAIKHMLADGYVRQELARASVYAAAVLLDEAGPATSSAGPDARRAVATAKRIAGEAALENVRTCIQVHGGMGFTWESPVHYSLKRAWVLENAFEAGRAPA